MKRGDEPRRRDAKKKSRTIRKIREESSTREYLLVLFIVLFSLVRSTGTYRIPYGRGSTVLYQT